MFGREQSVGTVPDALRTKDARPVLNLPMMEYAISILQEHCEAHYE